MCEHVLFSTQNKRWKKAAMRWKLYLLLDATRKFDLGVNVYIGNFQQGL